MKSNKIIICFFLIMLASGIQSVFAQFIHFSIKKNPGNPNQVDILFTPDFTAVKPAAFFEFGLQIPVASSPGVVATFVPNPAGPLRSLGPFQFYPAPGDPMHNGIDYGYKTYAWASTGVPIYANTYSYTAGIEAVAGTVTFSGGVPGSYDIVRAIDYQNQTPYGGSGTEVAIWTLQLDPSVTDYTDYANLFYMAVGSQVPNTNNDGGAVNQYVETTELVALPIVLTDFTAVKSPDGDAVNLNWEVAQEINTKTYGIERSADGVNYTTILTKTATNSQHYDATDTKPLNGLNYYRLYSIDVDGTKHYDGPLRTVLFGNGNTSVTQVTMAPNLLTGGNRTITFNVLQNTYAGAAQVIVSDAVGRRVQVAKINLLKGSTTVGVSVKGISAGSFFVSIIDGSGNKMGETQKLVVQ